ncbi:MAG: glutathione S-transferase family protein [Lysobacterales bacterium]
MLTLYITNKNYSSWSLRPWVLLKQLNIPFTEKLVPFSGKTAAATFRTFSPSGRVPCLVDGEMTVWDSLAITEYLAEDYPAVWPHSQEARAWARCATAEMHSGFQTMRNMCTMNVGLRINLNALSESLRADWSRIDSLWCEGLKRFGGPFLAGREFTGVDAFYAPVAFRVQTYSPPLSAAATEYVNRMLSLPAMKLWQESALAEPWRDEDHEQEARAVGAWIQDFRAQPVPSDA